MTRHEFMDAQIERSTQGAVKASQPQGVTVFHEAGGSYLLIENGKAVAARMTQAHAERFKRAINSHDALVAALTESQRWLSKLAADHDGDHIAQSAMRVHTKHKALLALTCPRCAKPTQAFGLCAECAKEERGQP